MSDKYDLFSITLTLETFVERSQAHCFALISEEQYANWKRQKCFVCEEESEIDDGKSQRICKDAYFAENGSSWCIGSINFGNQRYVLYIWHDNQRLFCSSLSFTKFLKNVTVVNPS